MVLAQFALIRVGINLDDTLALHYWSSPDFKWWQLLTHIFMHGSPNDISITIPHIFFNMWGLWMFGSILEHTWGPGKFIIFYLVCGFGAALCHLGVLTFEFANYQHAFLLYQQHPGFVEFMDFARHHGMQINPEALREWGMNKQSPEYISSSIELLNKQYREMTDITLVGASGAIFGLLFAFAYMSPNTELYIMFIPIPIKAKWAVAGYAAIELFSGVGAFKGDNVAHFAHLGGMLFAFLLLRIWKFNNRNRIY